MGERNSPPHDQSRGQKASLAPSGPEPELGRAGNSRAFKLGEGFGLVSKDFGEERYAALIDLAARARALFADDLDASNAKTDQRRALLFEIEDVLGDARRSRVKAKLPDDDGEITGD